MVKDTRKEFDVQTVSVTKKYDRLLVSAEVARFCAYMIPVLVGTTHDAKWVRDEVVREVKAFRKVGKESLYLPKAVFNKVSKVLWN